MLLKFVQYAKKATAMLSLTLTMGHGIYLLINDNKCTQNVRIKYL